MKCVIIKLLLVVRMSHEDFLPNHPLKSHSLLCLPQCVYTLVFGDFAEGEGKDADFMGGEALLLELAEPLREWPEKVGRRK